MLGLLDRWRERKAIRALEGALHGRRPLEEGVKAAQDLQELGTAQSVHALCVALTHGPEALRVVAPAALAAVYKRRHDARILKALNEAVLSEKQAEPVREAAIDALADVVSVRHVGSLIELLKATRTPLRVRTAAVRALARLGYPEVVERLVENYLFRHEEDPHGVVKRWVVERLKELDDSEKLTKLHEIAHLRRKLRYRAVSFEAGHPALIVHLMAEVDPDHAPRFLGHMVDHSTAVISRAAAKALDDIRSKRRAAHGHEGSHGQRHDQA